MKAGCAGIAFDLDGTLVESAPDLMNALNFALTRAGRNAVSLDAVKHMIGDGIGVLVEKGFAATGDLPEADELATAVEACLSYYEAHPVDESFAFEGVLDALGSLKQAGYVLSVCTNKPHAAAVSVLRAFELDGYFECVVGGDTYPFRKPDARMLLGTLKTMDVAPQRAVMVGDSHNDCLVAKGAGVAFVMASFGYNSVPLAQLGPDRVFDHFDDLPALVESLGL